MSEFEFSNFLNKGNRSESIRSMKYENKSVFIFIQCFSSSIVCDLEALEDRTIAPLGGRLLFLVQDVVKV